MSGFGHPEAFWLLAGAALMALYYMRASKLDARSRDAYADRARHASLGLGTGGWRPAAAAALLVLSVALSSIAIARPLGRPGSAAPVSAGVDVIVALDVSDSMAAADVSPDRLHAAKDFIARLTRSAPEARYGLVLFAGDAVVSCPLTVDHEAFLSFLEDADGSAPGLPGSALGEAVLTSATRFKKGALPRAVVVVSDGENTYGADPAGASKAAAGMKLKVFTAGVGTLDGGRIPMGMDFFGEINYKRNKAGHVVVSRLDDASLRDMAEKGGGSYFDASEGGSAGELADALKKLAAGGKAEEKKDPFLDAKEYGPHFALAAFCLLAVAVLL